MIQSFHIPYETHALCMMLVMNEKKEIPHARQAILVKNKSFLEAYEIIIMKKEILSWKN